MDVVILEMKVSWVVRILATQKATICTRLAPTRSRVALSILPGTHFCGPMSLLVGTRNRCTDVRACMHHPWDAAQRHFESNEWVSEDDNLLACMFFEGSPTGSCPFHEVGIAG